MSCYSLDLTALRRYDLNDMEDRPDFAVAMLLVFERDATTCVVLQV